MAIIKKVAPTAPKKDFIKQVDGFIGTTWSKAGELVKLTVSQAKYPLLQGWVKKK